MPTSPRSPQTKKQREKLMELIEISNEILSLAQRSDWQNVNRLADKRDKLLESFFGQAIESELVETIQNGIDEIRAADEEVVRLVKKNKAQLTDEITGLQTKKKHIQDYISNSR